MIPSKLIRETKAIIRFYQFLRYKCGLKYADQLSAGDIRRLLKALKAEENG